MMHYICQVTAGGDESDKNNQIFFIVFENISELDSFLLGMHCYRPHTKEDNVFTDVCHTVRGGGGMTPFPWPG